MELEDIHTYVQSYAYVHVGRCLRMCNPMPAYVHLSMFRAPGYRVLRTRLSCFTYKPSLFIAWLPHSVDILPSPLILSSYAIRTENQSV